MNTLQTWENDRDEWLYNRDNDYERETRGENEPTDYETDREIEYK